MTYKKIIIWPWGGVFQGITALYFEFKKKQ